MKKWRIGLLCALAALALAGCALSKPQEETETIPTIAQAAEGQATSPDGKAIAESLEETSDDTPAETQAVTTVDRTEVINGVTVHFAAEVLAPDWNSMATVTLAPDTEAQEQAAYDWILAEYPNADYDVTDYGVKDWSLLRDDGSLKISFSVFEDGIGAGFVDADKDLNSTGYEGNEDHMGFVPHYITALVPSQMEQSAEEAAATVAEALAPYTCFAYTPWNITAHESQKSGESGFYYMELQPVFEGFPVYGDGSSLGEITSGYSLHMSVWLSAEGIFSFQGGLLLKETGRERMERALSLEAAMEKILEDSPAYFLGETVEITTIQAAYCCVLANAEENAVSLVPGWVFECTDSGTENTGERHLIFFYEAQAGTLHQMDELY